MMKKFVVGDRIKTPFGDGTFCYGTIIGFRRVVNLNLTLARIQYDDFIVARLVDQKLLVKGGR